MSIQDDHKALWIKKQAGRQLNLFKAPFTWKSGSPQGGATAAPTHVPTPVAPQTPADAYKKLIKTLPEGQAAELREVSQGKFLATIKPARGKETKPLKAGEKIYAGLAETPELLKNFQRSELTPQGWKYVEKVPFKSRLGRAAIKGGLLGGGLLLAAGGVSLGKHLYEKMVAPIEFRKDFQSMMDHDKSLKGYDRDQVEARFRTLRKFNPDMSKDPLVSSSFVRQTMEIPIITPGIIKELTSAKPKEGKGSMGAERVLSGLIEELV